MTGNISLVKLAKGEPQLGVTFLGYVKSAAPHLVKQIYCLQHIFPTSTQETNFLFQFLY